MNRWFFYFLQVGIGLLLLQQLSGINAVLFYASTIFKSAGKFKFYSTLFGESYVVIISVVKHFYHLENIQVIYNLENLSMSCMMEIVYMVMTCIFSDGEWGGWKKVQRE